MPCLHPGPEVELGFHSFDQEQVISINGAQEGPEISAFSFGIL